VIDFDLFIILACIFEKSGTPDILRFTPDRWAGEGEGAEIISEQRIGFIADSALLLRAI
jgi:hypothetical protein